MNATYVSPVIAAVRNVFDTMIRLPVTSGKQSLKPDKRPTTEVAGIITMSGPLSGFICLGLPKRLACLLASRLLECDINDAGSECVDAIGEITNMIAGNAKSEFPEQGIAISPPRVVLDPQKEAYPTSAPVISIPFETQGVGFMVDMAVLADRKRG